MLTNFINEMQFQLISVNHASDKAVKVLNLNVYQFIICLAVTMS